MLNRTYFKGAAGCLVMFDVTNPETLKGALTWKQDLDDKVMLPSGSNVPAVLLGNKVREPTLFSNHCPRPEHCCACSGLALYLSVLLLGRWSDLLVTCGFCPD